MPDNITLSVSFEIKTLRDDVARLVATGMSIEEAIRSLPIGKYLQICDAAEGGRGLVTEADQVFVMLQAALQV